MTTYIDLLDTVVPDPNDGTTPLHNFVGDVPPGDGSVNVTVELLSTVTGGASLLGATPQHSNDALITWVQNGGDGSSGSGIFPSVLRIGDNNTVVTGFNTNDPGHTQDDVNSTVHTHTFQLSSLLAVNIDGETYYEFRLDLNQPNNATTNDISLDLFKVFTSATGAVPGDFDTSGNPLVAGFDPVYDMGPNALLLNSHNSGSGHADYIIYIPTQDFLDPPSSYVTLFAKFGGTAGFENAGGFEEFDAVEKPSVPVGEQGNFVALKIADTNDVCDPGATINYEVALIYTSATGDAYTVAASDAKTGGLTPIYAADGIHNIGDVTDLGKIDPGETWLYTASYTTTAADFALGPDGNHTATGTIDNTASFALTDTVNAAFSTTANTNTVSVNVDVDHLTIAKSTLVGATIHKTGGVADGVTGGSVVDNVTPHDVLGGTGITWTYDILNDGNVSMAAPNLSDLPSDSAAFSPQAFQVLNTGNPSDLTLYNSGDTNFNGMIDPGETWHYYATGTATGSATGYSYSNTATATDSFSYTDNNDNIVTCNNTTNATSGYTGVTAGVDIEKLVSGDGGKTWYFLADNGDNVTDMAALTSQTVVAGTLVVPPGTQLEFEVVVTNTSALGSGVSEVLSAKDAAPGTVLDGLNFTFGAGKSLTTNALAPGQSAISNVLTMTALIGVGNTDTATVTGTATDFYGDTGSVGPVSDSAAYTAVFNPDLGGLTIGYWYNHFTAPTKGTATGPYAAGVGGFDIWDPTGTNTTEKGILLGDVNGSLSHQSWETMLWIPDSAAHSLLNSSQTANDTRQILLSQAIATQLNIDWDQKGPGHTACAGDPGYIPGTQNISGDLITEAVEWLTGAQPFHFNDGSSGNVDLGGTTGTLDLTYDYTMKGTTVTLTPPALTSNKGAWQQQILLHSTDYGDFKVDGEGLKNALQALNQDHLVVSNDGLSVAWSASGSLTPGSSTDYRLNNPNDFWQVLWDHGLTGIWH